MSDSTALNSNTPTNDNTAPKKRGRPAKSSFYHVRWHTVGLNVERAAEVLNVSTEDVEAFDKNGCPMAEQFLLLWDRKHVGVDGWSGFYFSRGALCFRGRRWSAETEIKTKSLRGLKTSWSSSKRGRDYAQFLWIRL